MDTIHEEINIRRTFAIISHPDAGKTTLTEKLLLFGGAIQTAGAVKSKKNDKSTVSDFMEIEKQRGISVATSVMGFHYRGKKINLLDTPGHADFSEDTYRTLTAVDSALMVIDSTKGVEERTRSLCQVCSMRSTPIITFMNKLDREGRDPFEVLDEVEKELKIKVCPQSWPIGMGKLFKGVYSIYENRVILFKPHGKQDSVGVVEITDINDPKLDELLGDQAQKLREDVEIVKGVYPSLDIKEYLDGRITPVFFGSAVNNFGVRELLDCFVDLAPPPVSRMTDIREVQPDESKFTGFIFKIHANMDPNHRDRIAFLRICSGIFERNKRYYHVRSDKPYKSANPTAFMAQDKTIIDQAFPGDIIGLHDTGTFNIGDTVTEGEKLNYIGIPRFAPEIFKYVINLDPMKSKQLNKGLEQLSEEGVAQFFTKMTTGQKLIGAVGALQFEVIQYRLKNEYNASCRFESAEYAIACWIASSDQGAMDNFRRYYASQVAKDKEGKLVFLAKSKWMLERTQEDYPKIEFHFTSEF
ncbi:MAG TPA: peptide chain release factor 3 [Candidatus Margulisbacteria bacterium]|nr:MAG: peptide chain release factor 3 [Candidatus Margulisbacteria bacterium GWD2_39_127]OGI00888.1 MAG: peptide chain release factor 3 [Candidatus Margulisbacteria bacterium GWF2_38_17]OGI08743.1 MAG: peptide chain release factor 3 [Candidatus Margulisbacteria bacterium GWE2_39_32]HAR63492.1 peptide chain release factor 3 [Candidatus Margulisiibacteriota bacterium]HCT86070.1 peptide chain release factor 3 [Candidatus Margulisiibacteriota bacterium]